MLGTAECWLISRAPCLKVIWFFSMSRQKKTEKFLPRALSPNPQKVPSASGVVSTGSVLTGNGSFLPPTEMCTWHTWCTSQFVGSPLYDTLFSWFLLWFLSQGHEQKYIVSWRTPRKPLPQTNCFAVSTSFSVITLLPSYNGWIQSPFSTS